MTKQEQYIPSSECKHGWLYKISSRNLTLGVFRKDKMGFVGIPEKFGREYLFVEYHRNTGEPFGTVKPQHRLERCPIENLDEYLKRGNGKREDNKLHFDWLMEKELEHIGSRNKKHERPSTIVIFGEKRV